MKARCVKNLLLAPVLEGMGAAPSYRYIEKTSRIGHNLAQRTQLFNQCAIFLLDRSIDLNHAASHFRLYISSVREFRNPAQHIGSGGNQIVIIAAEQLQFKLHANA